MARIVQCVPNFSEGRDIEKIEKIVGVFQHTTGYKMVSYEPDADYNRTVVTLLGDPDAIIEGMLHMFQEALTLIDMNHHKGEHARMGAIDVVPFIPIEEVTMDECVAYANQLGEKVAATFDIPVFLYANAATKSDRVQLPNIRKGEFEGMKEKIKDPHWKPDFGKSEIHETFGVVGIGARIPLIAYNIDLDTTDTKIASNIARAIRFSNGGFRYIQAGPVFLEGRGHVQVTMNILDYQKNPVYRILETVKMEARRYGVAVPSCELVGLCPKDTLLRSLKYYFAVDNIDFNNDMSLDEITAYTIKYMGFRDFQKEKIIEANI